ncbi:protein eiger [Anopheles maculipalpis]|uniref:protein eiger n=1 Tax=Anopheles maculipalpis TaxID=1496333 RepID=UPI002158C114|nr:protein eiger [Anopheles maculipalpis]
MTAETLKPFLNLPNATAGDLKAHCAQKSTVKRGLVALGCILAVALCCALIGVQIWHLNKTAILQQEVDDLKLQLYLRSREFTDYEFDNELFDNPDEYVYEPEDLDPDMSDDGHHEQETNESGLSSSGMQGEDDDLEDSEEKENLGIEDLRETNDDDEDIIVDDRMDISVAGGKRRARSISGVTRQGVPIVDEPYVPRRNRTRHPHRIFEQLRQRPVEQVTPPTSAEMFRWDVDNRKTHTASRHQSYGSISIRPYQHEAHNHREHHSTTTPMPVAYGSHAGVRHHSRNELHAGNPTKPPAQILNRLSRVQATGESMRKQLQQTQRFPKVVGNPGTQKEIVMAPESRVRLRQRKGGAVQPVEPVAKGVHLVELSDTAPIHSDSRYQEWSANDNASKQAIQSSSFSFDGEQLTINEPGLYYVYAQITYSNEFDANGYKVLINGRKHLSCTVSTAQGENTNTCFTAGIAEIANAGTRIAIQDVDHGRQHVMYPEKTFFGAFKIGRLAAPTVTHRRARKVA